MQGDSVQIGAYRVTDSDHDVLISGPVIGTLELSRRRFEQLADTIKAFTAINQHDWITKGNQ